MAGAVSTAIDLQDTAITILVPGDAVGRSTVVGPVCYRGWSRSAEWPILSGIGQEPGGLHLSRAWRERRYSGLVGKDALALFDGMQVILSHRLELEAAAPSTGPAANGPVQARLGRRSLPGGRVATIGVLAGRQLVQQRLGRYLAPPQEHSRALCGRDSRIQLRTGRS